MHQSQSHICVRQWQYDATAGIFYAKGVSLVHLAMVVGWFFVQHPNFEVLSGLQDPDNECLIVG